MHHRSRKPELFLSLLPLLLMVTLVTACNGDDDAFFEQVTVELEERNDSGYSGSALLVSPDTGEITIVIALGREDSLEGDFPVAVNQGTCEELTGSVIHDLDRLSNGTLSAEVSGSLSQLRDRDHSIAVYSSTDRSLYVACGDL